LAGLRVGIAKYLSVIFGRGMLIKSARLWFMVIVVLPLVIDFMYPNMIPLLCWLNLSVIYGR
jgi:hypothetical protein